MTEHSTILNLVNEAHGHPIPVHCPGVTQRVSMPVHLVQGADVGPGPTPRGIATLKDGVFTCCCGAKHARGPVDGGHGYRCLKCGDTSIFFQGTIRVDRPEKFAKGGVIPHRATQAPVVVLGRSTPEVEASRLTASEARAAELEITKFVGTEPCLCEDSERHPPGTPCAIPKRQPNDIAYYADGQVFLEGHGSFTMRDGAPWVVRVVNQSHHRERLLRVAMEARAAKWGADERRLNDELLARDKTIADLTRARNQEAIKRAEAEREVAAWKSTQEMYVTAWLRELGGRIIHKTHQIDGFVLTTRKMREDLEAAKKTCADVLDIIDCLDPDRNVMVQYRLGRSTIEALCKVVGRNPDFPVKRQPSVTMGFLRPGQAAPAGAEVIQIDPDPGRLRLQGAEEAMTKATKAEEDYEDLVTAAQETLTNYNITHAALGSSEGPVEVDLGPLRKALEKVQVYCHACSQAGGADMPVHHKPPACPPSTQQKRGE